MTQAVSLAQLGNGPTFGAKASGGQTLANNTYTKIVFDQKQWDTNSNYNATTGQFQPTVAGYYQINATAGVNQATGECVVAIYKNGSPYVYPVDATPSNTWMLSGSALVPMNGTTDYLEVYFYHNSGTAKSVTAFSFFTGFLARGA